MMQINKRKKRKSRPKNLRINTIKSDMKNDGICINYVGIVLDEGLEITVKKKRIFFLEL